MEPGCGEIRALEPNPRASFIPAWDIVPGLAPVAPLAFIVTSAATPSSPEKSNWAETYSIPRGSTHFDPNMRPAPGGSAGLSARAGCRRRGRERPVVACVGTSGGDRTRVCDPCLSNSCVSS